jgi:ATP-dependent DNA helicase PIF1
MLAVLDKFCKATFCNTTSVFGHCNVLLIGDIGQLPPVKGTRCMLTSLPQHMSAATHQGCRVFQSFKQCYELLQVFRIQNDETSVVFKGILKRLRLLSPNENDYKALHTLVSSQIGGDTLFTPGEVTTIHSTNAAVDQCNFDCIVSFSQRNGTPLSHFTKQPSLQICIGARITLTSNISVQTGLLNGALGYVTHIIYAQHVSLPSMPQCIIIKFDNYMGPSIDPVHQKCAPTFPCSMSQKGGGTKRMFPLRLAYSMTVHKCQGKTISDKVIFDMSVPILLQE